MNIIPLMITTFFCLIIWARHCEKEQWNNGKCLKCGSHLEQFDTDSHGGRGYSCSARCNEGSIWISWGVDKIKPKTQKPMFRISRTFHQILMMG